MCVVFGYDMSYSRNDGCVLVMVEELNSVLDM